MSPDRSSGGDAGSRGRPAGRKGAGARAASGPRPGSGSRPGRGKTAEGAAAPGKTPRGKPFGDKAVGRSRTADGRRAAQAAEGGARGKETAPARPRRVRAEAVTPAEAQPAEKLQKVLADRGYASRRTVEQWIAAGRVVVNGEPAHVGQRVGPGDRILIDGEPLRQPRRETPRVLVLNKASGVICSRSDPEGRPTVFDGLPGLASGRWIAVGRLDFMSSGLLLITNDGALANRMMHPSTGLDREYAVRVNGKLSDAEIGQLKRGVEVEGEQLRFSDIRYYNGSGTNHWYHVVLMEGKNREVRRLFEAVGLVVSRLKRVRYGPVFLSSTLRSGRWAELGDDDRRALYRLVGLPVPPAERRGRGRPEREREPSLLLPYPGLERGRKS